MLSLRREGKTLPCDRLLAPKTIAADFPGFEMAEGVPDQFWSTGINLLSETEFVALAEEFIKWCQSLQEMKIYIVSHECFNPVKNVSK
ncbi:hypothetical protein ELQ35_00245 [Peribacillus cavernae]|uniref:Uncharacterized protein n=1 Tax=Peribacillus cavernae TaxID=1674310 RepID=A0A3S0VTW4_9BACI|nr:hypothetical protein [Peribacillus cavernae]MDQ0217912.1 hypothetical protein [Peribacillus cavernae]RUQ32567.1 hypothetical protein ELQ35_00245 [Peribacillus cavernae]